MKKLAFSLAIALTALISGCGKSTKYYPVQGKVTFRGAPASGALVYFHLKGNTNPNLALPYAKVLEDGTFKVVMATGEEGAPAGDYDVTMYWPDTSAAGGDKEKGGSRDNPPDKFAGKYLKAGPNTPAVTVKPEKNELTPFDLK
jgi:hypothetical protein